MKDDRNIKKVVLTGYGAIARGERVSCCGPAGSNCCGGAGSALLAQAIGYDVAGLDSEARKGA